MSDLTTIQELTTAYAECRAVLTGRVQALQLQIDRLQAEHINGIRAAVREAAVAHDQLRGAIADAPELFQRPKTLTIAGIRIGYMKQRGQVVIEDEAAVVARIRKLLPAEQADLLIRTRENVHKPAVYDLTAGDLKRLGIAITADEETVIIKPVDSEVDKLVSALLAEAERIEEAA